MRVATLLSLSLICLPSLAVEIELIDRASQQVIPTYFHKGRTYVAGEPGREYEIRLRNDSRQRLLAVTTVDGVNVISGETGATDQTGYVLDAYETARIEGWRKSMSRTAAFYFTRLSDSYAARTGRPDNVGVIGVALFRERETPRYDLDLRPQEHAAAEASSPPSAADSAASERSSGSKLGTGHGRNAYSPAQYANFERASDRPYRTLVLYYDSYRNLQAAGIIPRTRSHARNLPNPFPGFVRDP